MSFADAYNDLADRAIADTLRSNGRLNLGLAAIEFLETLKSLEAGGVEGVSACRETAELEGHRRYLGARARTQMVSVTRGDSRVRIPAMYATRDDQGHYQLSLWLDMPLDELGQLIDSLVGQADILAERSSLMRRGLALARQHGVNTAREGFAAEGIDIEAA